MSVPGYVCIYECTCVFMSMCECMNTLVNAYVCTYMLNSSSSGFPCYNHPDPYTNSPKEKVLSVNFSPT